MQAMPYTSGINDQKLYFENEISLFACSLKLKDVKTVLYTITVFMMMTYVRYTVTLISKLYSSCTVNHLFWCINVIFNLSHHQLSRVALI